MIASRSIKIFYVPIAEPQRNIVSLSSFIINSKSWNPINKQTLENNERQSKMDNPEKLATYGTQDEEKRNKDTTQYVLDTTMGNQTQIM